MKMSHTLITISVVLTGVIHSIPESHGNEKRYGDLILDLRSNPDVVNAGDNITLILSIMNGDKLLKIISTELKSPSLLLPPRFNDTVSLPANRTYTKEYELKIPTDFHSGKYSFLMNVNTNQGSYFVDTDVTINRFESIGLSGNIPNLIL